MPAPSLQLVDDVWNQMLYHVLAMLPEEACGLIGGSAGRGQVVLPVTNAAQSSVRYRMDPAGQVKALLAIEAQGLELVAIFHSHPAGPAGPSATDVAEYAYPEAVCLIWSPDPEWTCRGYDLADGSARAIRLVLPEGRD
jgi:proteasome lid subunit RPN8/RPN11